MEYIKVWIVLWVIAAYIAACIFVPGAEGKLLCFYGGAIYVAWAKAQPTQTTQEDLRKLRFK